jgi:hypothetical protein
VLPALFVARTDTRDPDDDGVRRSSSTPPPAPPATGQYSGPRRPSPSRRRSQRHQRAIWSRRLRRRRRSSPNPQGRSISDEGVAWRSRGRRPTVESLVVSSVGCLNHRRLPRHLRQAPVRIGGQIQPRR